VLVGGLAFSVVVSTARFASLLSGALSVVSNLAFILTLVLFMTVDASQFPRILLNARSTRPNLVGAPGSFAASTRSYLLVSTAFGLIVAVIVIYSAINVMLQSVIQPKVVGDAVGLSTTLTFLSLVFWSWSWSWGRWGRSWRSR
jgi:AI-2 transport protein TqsA